VYFTSQEKMHPIKNFWCEDSALGVKNATGSRQKIVPYGVKLSHRKNVFMNP
jgi:hypothetical protein